MSESHKEEIVDSPNEPESTSPERDDEENKERNETDDTFGGIIQRVVWKVVRNRMLFMTFGFFVLSYLWNPNKGATPKGKVSKSSTKEIDKYQNRVLRSEYQRGMQIVISAYISSSEDMTTATDVSRLQKWKSRFGKIGTLSMTDTVPRSLLRDNQTVWLHLEFTSPGALTATYSHKLVTYRSTKKVTRNLLSESPEETTTCENDDLWAPVWQSVVDFTVVEEFTGKLRRSELPEMFTKYLQHHDHKTYFPLVVENDFWVDPSDYKLVNISSEEEDPLPLTINVTSVSLAVFSLYENFKMHEESGLMDRDSDIRKLLRGPLVLIVTVSLLHSLFSFLAFKNDVQFWRRQNKVTGRSLTSMAMRIGMQSVILLYLIDNNASKLVTFNVGFGVAIEIWKINKFRKLATTGPQSAEDETLKYDQQAARYLFYGMLPLLLCYSCYSFVYHSFKGYYNFILSTLVRFIYWFGCAMMTPQLFVNYKLRSVAHMPWRAFVYKGISTFIDDIFAFSMEMPTAHRLATLRDDVVFVIYLIQYYMYKVDKTRINEFGQCSADSLTVEELEKKLVEEEITDEQRDVIKQALELKVKGEVASSEPKVEATVEQQQQENKPAVISSSSSSSNEEDCEMVRKETLDDDMLPSDDDEDEDGFVEVNHDTL
eukprot:TRINITY_DN641_c1_g1_i1.p1 TRINITY_DN641_c1_g1~~TRINITY_DN641_c1_g1_i1.p1  ORF type:complete len:655 (+),score=115.04 TRINITY_DN641_c1_g1_i1:122-2086(+)